MTMWDILLEELALSQRIVRDGEEVVPRFRMFTPEGQFVVLVPLDPDQERRLRLLHAFMTWKMAIGFILAAETRAPDAITVALVTRNECRGLLRRISRGNPISFGADEALEARDIGSDLLALLPARASTITVAQQQELSAVFGRHGEMPAHRVV
jgi:hypothetical protein